MKRIREKLSVFQIAVVNSVFFATALIIADVLFSLLRLNVNIILVLNILWIIIWMLFIMLQCEKKRSEKSDKEIFMLEKENELSEYYYRCVSEKFDEINKFCHDARNYLNMFSNKKDDFDKYEQIAQKFIEKGESLSANTCCENRLLDALLSQKKECAELNGIKFTCDVVISDDVAVDGMDLCSCFFNLLDNAIEANITEIPRQDKWISIKANTVGSFLIIKQSNSIFNTVKPKKENMFETSKADRKNHGYGLNIIAEAAQKYNGYAEFETLNNVFYSNVYFDVNSQVNK